MGCFVVKPLCFLPFLSSSLLLLIYPSIISPNTGVKNKKDCSLHYTCYANASQERVFWRKLITCVRVMRANGDTNVIKIVKNETS